MRTDDCEPPRSLRKLHRRPISDDLGDGQSQLAADLGIFLRGRANWPLPRILSVFFFSC